MKNKPVICIHDGYGWKQYKNSEIVIWFKGYLLDGSIEDIFDQIADYCQHLPIDLSTFSNMVNQLRGHFGLICITDNFVFGVADKNRSIPVFYSNLGSRVTILNHAPDLKDLVKPDQYCINDQAVLELAMSGYTIGKKSIFNGISQLTAGSYLLYQEESLVIRRYYDYKPWNLRSSTEKVFKSDLSEVTWNIIHNMVNSVHGRQIVVPLSAGNDSRLIVSLLKELKVKDVHCVSYGLPGNFEAETAKLIAERLGYKWTFIPLSIKNQKKAFSQKIFDDYLKFSDSLVNSPVLIDYSAIQVIKNSKLVSDDAVFVNGNSGDFISGAHISSYVSDGVKTDVNTLIKGFINKHYSLWRCLKTDCHLDKITAELENYVLKLIDTHSIPEELFWTVGENLEWMGRQTKLVSTTQRSYEFHGYDWRLPLWDPLYMDFWEGVPREYKYNQKLYKDMLMENNWGKVWHDIGVNNYTIPSNFLRVIRFIAKVPFVFSSKERWQNFDQRFFGYYFDNTASTAFVSYKDTFFDSCGARNRNSWITKSYLSKYGIDLAELV